MGDALQLRSRRSQPDRRHGSRTPDVHRDPKGAARRACRVPARGRSRRRVPRGGGPAPDRVVDPTGRELLVADKGPGELARLDSRGHNGRRPDVELRITQDDLAACIGTTRESVGRAPGRFRGDGILTTGHGRIQVHDLDTLSFVAASRLTRRSLSADSSQPLG